MKMSMLTTRGLDLTNEERKEVEKHQETMQFYLQNHEKEIINNTLPEKDKECLFQAFYNSEKIFILKAHTDPVIITKKLDELMEIRKTGFSIMKMRPVETQMMQVIGFELNDN